MKQGREQLKQGREQLKQGREQLKQGREQRREQLKQGREQLKNLCTVVRNRLLQLLVLWGKEPAGQTDRQNSASEEMRQTRQRRNN